MLNKLTLWKNVFLFKVTQSAITQSGCYENVSLLEANRILQFCYRYEI